MEPRSCWVCKRQFGSVTRDHRPVKPHCDSPTCTWCAACAQAKAEARKKK